MTAVQPIDPSEMLSEQLAAASPDLLRNRLSTFIGALMSERALTSDHGRRARRPDSRFESELFPAVHSS